MKMSSTGFRMNAAPWLRLRTPILLLLVLICSACQQTRFAALPSGTESACDSDWVGAWRVDAEGTESDKEPAYWIVKPDCAGYQTLEEEGISEDEDEFRFRYVQQGKSRYIAAASRPDLKAADQDWEHGFMLFRYEVLNKNKIRVHAIDNQRIAHLIVDGEIKGRTAVSNDSKDPRARDKSIRNLVSGDSKATDAVLKRKDIYDPTPWLILHRASDAEIAKFKERMLDQRSPEGG